MRIICALAVRMGSKDQRISRVDIFHQGYAGPLEALPRATTFLEEQDGSLVALRRQAIKMATKSHTVSGTISCNALIDWITFLVMLMNKRENRIISITFPQGGEMPLEQLLALYGYNMPDPVLKQQQEPNELAASLPEMTLDKVTITEIIKVIL